MANIGSEVERALDWMARGRTDYSRNALERALELLGLTLSDPRQRHRLKEIARVREILLDFFFGDNVYGSTEEGLRRYFYPYALAVALKKERER
jgi:hypothetical protein